MTAPNNLELQGNLQEHPAAELLIEISEARLDGSLRISNENQKIIFYFKSGEIVFAASNARRARLFDMLLHDGVIDKNLLAENSNFASDFELAKFLVEKQIFRKDEIDKLFVRQLEEITRAALCWKTGAWEFSPLVRIREDIRFQIDLSKILIEYARSLSEEIVFQRFRSFQEIFIAGQTPEHKVDLHPQEAFILSRFKDTRLSVEEVKSSCPLPLNVVLQALYTLWLGGLLTRRGWHPAFTGHRIEAISTARIALKKEAAPPESANSAAAGKSALSDSTTTEEKYQHTDEKARLESYLDRTEKSRDYYESLGIETKASLAEIKQSYFSLAKQFHPDRFHKETGTELHRRIQKAFTVIAKAYETLRDENARETYDFKLRKELSQTQNFPPASAFEIDKRKQSNVAAEIFEEGFKLLKNNNCAEALPFLARAVHSAPETGLYHAYYGKALAEDETQRFKAEAELQTAVKLEPGNAVFRVILAEFFIRYNLLKRAEGELTRFLAIAPGNREARALLDSLQKKKLN
jgi:curved DNA-binding protein CbpA